MFLAGWAILESVPRKSPRTRYIKAGRKDNTDADKMEALGRMGATLELCAAVFGVEQHTLSARCKREPELLIRYKKGWADKGKLLQETAYNLAPRLAKKGNVSLLIFLLKTRYGFKEATVVQEKTGEEDPRTVSLEKMRSLSTEELKVIREIFSRQSEPARLEHSPSGERTGRVYEGRLVDS